ncbi:MAG TPA: ROK family protein [Chitinophagaceae bacterium]|jgi:polyphosphate glucokinase|nr:ROK family protein [Chitinophagaceae bacterium]
MENSLSDDKILSIDIGGSNVKVTLLNRQGELLVDYKKTATPEPASPANVIEAVKGLLTNFPGFDMVSVGFPGYVKQGVIHTAPNLGTELWRGVDLQNRLSEVLGKPVKVVNDADMLGLGVISGKGFEMVVTLGTGFGTAFVQDGVLLPHLELAHHPVSKDQTYDQYVGEAALDNKGLEKWNERIKKILVILKTVFNYDTLYIGGGNSKKLNFRLEPNIKIFSNKEGIKGGARLWQVNNVPPINAPLPGTAIADGR